MRVLGYTILLIVFASCDDNSRRSHEDISPQEPAQVTQNEVKYPVDDLLFTATFPVPFDTLGADTIFKDGLRKLIYHHESDTLSIALAKYMFPKQVFEPTAKLAKDLHNNLKNNMKRRYANVMWYNERHTLVDSGTVEGWMLGHIDSTYWLTVDYYRIDSLSIQLITYADSARKPLADQMRSTLRIQKN